MGSNEDEMREEDETRKVREKGNWLHEAEN